MPQPRLGTACLHQAPAVFPSASTATTLQHSAQVPHSRTAPGCASSAPVAPNVLATSSSSSCRTPAPYAPPLYEAARPAHAESDQRTNPQKVRVRRLPEPPIGD